MCSKKKILLKLKLAARVSNVYLDNRYNRTYKLLEVSVAF